MKIIPLYRFENIILVGLESDYQNEENVDSLVTKINLRTKKIDYPAWSGQKMLKFGYYFPIDKNERSSIYDLIKSKLGEEVINEIENILLFPSKEAIDSLIWIPERLKLQ